MSNQQLISREIQRLHDFFTAWFNGTIAEAEYDRQCGNHLSKNFLNVQPGGARLTREVFNAAIKSGYGANPDFKILTRNAEIREILVDGKLWLVTYEEYQKGAKSSANHNARFSTLLIEQRGEGGNLEGTIHEGTDQVGYLWHHIHETWLPADHHGPEYFEF